MGLRDFRSYTATLAANGEQVIDVNGRYIVGIEANGAFDIAVDDGPYSRFFNGAKALLPEDESFTKIRVRDRSGAPNSVVLQVGYGDFTDGRLQVSGVLRVADDDDAETSFVEIQTRLQVIENLLRNADDKRTALTDLTGASYADVTGVNTVTVVSAASNVAGVVIRVVNLSAANSQAQLLIAGNVVLEARSTVSESAYLKDIFVPAGVAVALMTNDNNASAYMAYEVLPLEQ